MPDRDDLRLLVGVAVVSLGVLWFAVVLGAAVWLFRLLASGGM